MHTIIKLAAVTATALLLGTGLASANGLVKFIESGEAAGLGGSVNNSSVSGAVKSAVIKEQVKDAIHSAVVSGAANNAIQDAVLDGINGVTVIVDGRELTLAIACEAGGSKLLTLRNKGDVVPAGAKVRWEVASLGERGAVRLKSDLGAGSTVRVDIGMSVDAGTPCAAKVI
jgi:hypothetical protein